MFTILAIVFWLMLGIIFYVYVGYPLLLWSYSKFHRRTVRSGKVFPSVSIIIAAFNEEKAIENKIRNSLELNYPRDRLEIIVASDCSTDQTNQIVERFHQQGVILHRQLQRKGKTAALNAVLPCARGEILLFSDATAMLDHDCLQNLVQNFVDEQVGCVSPVMVYQNNKCNYITQLEELYWKYESSIKRWESDIGTLAFVPGACFAIRKKLQLPVLPEYDYDCISPLLTIEQKHRVVYAPDARFYETPVNSSQDLFKTRVRMITKDFAGTLSRKSLIHPLKNPMISMTLVSHKLLRWLIPFVLILLFACNLFLLESRLFQIFLIGQIAVYLLAFLGIAIKHKHGLFFIPFYFCIMNLAALVGVSRAIIGKKVPIWQPVR
ncbi:MAG: glycosyltransferase family 2 protein [candidate division KSB1 bacterium]|nr:glycosyltransferase family 2 protein [candidate division KSB1 bacterium]MDZ7341284.1 glycosyltransferase family 2 protein [candidate division KSB1 bacterium]